MPRGPMSHSGSSGGPRYGRGRKHIVHTHWTRAEVALALSFLLVVVLVVMLGLYLGWWSLRQEEQTSSPGQASVLCPVGRCGGFEPAAQAPADPERNLGEQAAISSHESWITRPRGVTCSRTLSQRCPFRGDS
jgi:hypothetical protein